MNPQEIFCPMIACPARGQTGKENIHIHSLKDQRCLCDVCGQTFTTTKGTIFYRLHTDPQIVMCVIVLLAYGCPVVAIVKDFLLDERTVRDWQRRAGQHCQQVHEHLVENSQHNLEQVQAVEIKTKTQQGTLWMALDFARDQPQSATDKTDGSPPNSCSNSLTNLHSNIRIFNITYTRIAHVRSTTL
jgi:transposase-like protein